MDYNAIFAIGLVLIGFTLIIAEVFIPSGGVILTLCVMCFAFGVYFAKLAWYASHPVIFWTFLGSLGVLIPAFVAGVFTIMPRTKIGKKILLEAPDPEEVTPYLNEQRRLEQLIGQFGKATTNLNPGGMIQVQGERFHGFSSEGMIVPRGDDVRVVAVRGNRIVVRPVLSGEIESAQAEQEAREREKKLQQESAKPVEPDDRQVAAGDEELPPLDLEFPER